MAMDPKIKAAIELEIRERKAVTVDDIANIIKMYDVRPDPVQLIEQYYRRKARSFISNIRDENGQRDLFAIKTEDGERLYVNIPNEDNLIHLEAVQAQLNAKYQGLNRSKLKVQNRQREVSNQMVFDFEKKG